MKILWICFVWPEPDSSAAGTRTIELLNILKNAGHEIRVCSPCQPNSYKEALSNLGFITEYQAANDSRFDTFIEQYQPDIVFFDRFVIEEQFSWRVRQYCPDALRVLDTIDLHSLRRARQRKVQEGLDARELSIPDLQSEDAIREIAAIYRSDLSLIVSDFEIEFLQRNYNLSDSLLALCRFSSSKLEIVPSFEERCHFVSIGNFNHAPNIDSFKVLQENIWAEIKVRLENMGIRNSELHIYGAYPKNEIIALDNKASGFRVLGKTEDVRETLSKYRVILAPLRFGAGIKGKILDAWSVGTPAIASPIAAEGMYTGHQFGGCVEDDWRDFAQSAVKLYSEYKPWESAQKNGFSIIEDLFNPKKNTQTFLQTLELCLTEKNRRRHNNFTGQILWHNKNRSSEYFSRWIEVKNCLLSDKADVK